jgi:hypothetical protein
MRKINLFAAAAAAAALILAGVGGWTNSTTRALGTKAAAPINVQIDTFQLTANAKNLPIQEFEDFSLVFPRHSRVGEPSSRREYVAQEAGATR